MGVQCGARRGGGKLWRWRWGGSTVLIAFLLEAGYRRDSGEAMEGQGSMRAWQSRAPRLDTGKGPRAHCRARATRQVTSGRAQSTPAACQSVATTALVRMGTFL